MAVSEVGTPTAATLTNASNSFNISMPAGIQQGDLIVIFHAYNRSAASGYSHNVPAGFTQRLENRVNSQSALVAVFEKFAVGDETTVTLSRSDADATRNDAACVLLRGVHPIDPVGASLDPALAIPIPKFASNTTAPACTWTTEAPDGSYAIVGFGCNSTTTITAETGGFTNPLASGKVLALERKVIATAETPATTLTATSHLYAGIGLVYVPYGGVTGFVKAGMTASGFTHVGGAPTIASAMNDSDDATYLESQENPDGQQLDIPLTPMSAPAGPTNLRVRLRWQRNGGTEGSVTHQLLDAGGVVRSTQTVDSIDTTATDYQVSFPSADVANVPSGDWATGLTVRALLTSA